MVILENVRKNFEGKEIIRDLSLTFGDGTVTVLFGESGIGKTTILRIISGLAAPDRGSVRADGIVSMVFQEPRLLPWKNTVENVMISGCDRNTAERLLEGLGLKDEFRTLPSRLSGGMAQRVAIARALGSRADVLLLDEPFTGLDEETARRCADFIRSEAKDTAVIIIVTHNRAMAEYMTDRIITIG